MQTILDVSDHNDLFTADQEQGVRSRSWMILTYDDNDQFKNILSRLKDLDWDFAGRIHDQEKKPHYHIVCVFREARTNTAVAKDLGIEIRWLSAWDKKKRALRYLCHKDDQEKFQYSPDNIFGTIAETAIQLCSKGDLQSEQQTVLDIFSLIESCEGIVTYSWLLKQCAEQGLYATFRRMGNLAIKLVDEHNDSVRRMEIEQRWKNDKSLDRNFGKFLEKSTSKDFVEKCKDLDQVGFSILPLDD